MEMCGGTIFPMKNHNQVLPEECIHGVVNWESMLIIHSCLIGQRKKNVNYPMVYIWRHEAKQGKKIVGNMPVDVEITLTPFIRNTTVSDTTRHRSASYFKGEKKDV